jgi:hypothetical protein
MQDATATCMLMCAPVRQSAEQCQDNDALYVTIPAGMSVSSNFTGDGGWR